MSGNYPALRDIIPELKTHSLFLYVMNCVLENVENHSYLQKRFEHKLRFQESPGTISRSGGGGPLKPWS